MKRSVFCLIYLLALCAWSGEPVVSGRPIPIEGLGQVGAAGIQNVPLGTYMRDGAHYLVALNAGCRMNHNRIFLYKIIGAQPDGTPLCARVRQIPAPTGGVSNLDHVFQVADGTVYGFFFDRKAKLHLRLRLNFDTMAFEPAAKPLQIDSLRAIVPAADGAVFFYSFSRTTLRPAEAHEIHPWLNKERYLPFDGTLTWRNAEAREYLVVRRLSRMDADDLSAPVQATTTREEMNSISAGSSYRDGAGRAHLLVGSNEGVVGHYLVGENGQLSPVQLCRVGDAALHAPQIWMTACVWLVDGKPNLFTGGEGGLVSYRFDSYAADGTPVYQPCRRVLEDNTELYFGTLPVVNAADWDGDGLTDIVIGNSAGELGWAKNVGRPGAPLFVQPLPILLEGEPFMEKGGYYNLQGAVEAQYGYVGATAIDWDGDGLLDIVSGDNSSHYGVYFNRGTRTAANLTHRQRLYCNGMTIHGMWRQRPGVGRLANGKVGYAMLDWDNELRLYHRLDKFNLVDRGKLRLADGSPVTAGAPRNGESGRSKFVLKDVDGDGKTDILVGTIGCHTYPFKDRGFPRNIKGRAAYAAVFYFRNIGTDDAPVLDLPALLQPKPNVDRLFTDAERRVGYFGWHSCSADVADFGGDMQGILVGMEDGRHYFFKHSDIEWKPFTEVADR